MKIGAVCCGKNVFEQHIERMKKILVFLLFLLFVYDVHGDDNQGITTCAPDEIEANDTCLESKFEVTTTDMPADTEFSFFLSAAGTFYVDWGDGVVEKINRKNNTNDTLYSHTYTTSGVRKIRYTGTPTGYTHQARAALRFGLETGEASGTPQYITAISGKLSGLFPKISSNLPKFRNSFRSAALLTSIPEDLFAGLSGCTSNMFYQTFLATGLQSIPPNIFKDISCSSDNMFRTTFSRTKITTIPEGLFSSISNSAPYMFYMTFNNCANLTGYVPPSIFSGLISNGSPTANAMWENTFAGTKLVTTCPSGTTEFNTGYKTSWKNIVSCVEDTNIVCPVGEYLPQYFESCITCPENAYCTGGTYNFNSAETQGITQCANNTYSPTGSDVCYPHILHIGDNNIYLSSTKITTPSLNVKFGNDVFYANMTPTQTYMNKDSQHYLKTLYNDQTYYICDNTIFNE